MSKKAPRRPELLLGQLPVDVINRTLDLELEAATVVVTRSVQVHAERRHPAEYASCLPHVARIVLDPLYIGDDFRNPGKIELIGRVAFGDGFLLVALEVSLIAGRYEVRSFYTIDQEDIDGRFRRGFLKRPKP